MDIEIVEFYPTQKDSKQRIIKGTMHIYLIPYEIDIRGILCSCNGKSWWFQMPFSSQWDNVEKKIMRFPIFSFSNKEKYEEIITFLKTKGKDYIIKNFTTKK